MELNDIIDKALPGCPPFKTCEVTIGGETLELHYRDILTCIRSLYGDPEFIQDLIFPLNATTAIMTILAMFIVRCILEIGGGWCRCVNVFDSWNVSNQITDYP